MDAMVLAYAVADLALCRGGATTVAELGVVGLPSIVVPYPHHRDRQQERHGRVLERAGAAVVLPDEDTTTPAGRRARRRTARRRQASEGHAGERARCRSSGSSRRPGPARPGGSRMIASARRIHFVGIGGAGMSAIAKVLLERGFERVGLGSQEIARGNDARGDGGIRPHRPRGIVGGRCGRRRLLDGHPSTQSRARTGTRDWNRSHDAWRGIGVHYSTTLKSIVVAGTHGKTTTTSMIVSVLHSEGLDPTYLVGGGLNDVGTNARHGRDELAVAEADESDGSFLLLTPHIAVVTNIEADHLDHWGTFDAIADGFKSWLGAVGRGAQWSSPRMTRSCVATRPRPGASRVTFGPGGDVEARDVEPEASGMSFTLVHGDSAAPVALRVPGRHNVANALAAAAACLQIGLSVESIARGLGEYRGVERRFQIRGELDGVTIIDDYAHHPTEVQATLEAARGGPYKRVVAVFQPHRYSRTQALHEDFGASFDDADRIVITDVYGAGEQPVPGVTGKLISDAVCAHLPGRAVAYLPHHGELVAYLRASSRPGDALLTLGAGDISALGEELLQRRGGVLVSNDMASLLRRRCPRSCGDPSSVPVHSRGSPPIVSVVPPRYTSSPPASTISSRLSTQLHDARPIERDTGSCRGARVQPGHLGRGVAWSRGADWASPSPACIYVRRIRRASRSAPESRFHSWPTGRPAERSPGWSGQSECPARSGGPFA